MVRRYANELMINDTQTSKDTFIYTFILLCIVISVLYENLCLNSKYNVFKGNGISLQLSINSLVYILYNYIDYSL